MTPFEKFACICFLIAFGGIIVVSVGVVLSGDKS